MRRKLVIGNWKMNGSLAANASLLELLRGPCAELDDVDVALCPPFPYLASVRSLLIGTDVDLGAQNLSDAANGAYTGEVSASMLADLACTYVLVGHSERRTLFGESDALVASKYRTALQAGLIPVLCVGETLAQRRNGQTEAVVDAQLQAVIDLLGVKALAQGVIAYEPVWAIGTGETASPEQAQQVHAHIRGRVAALDPQAAQALRILYGGSVKADNAAALFACPDIDGGLIGGASLDANGFIAICKAGHAL